MNMKISLAGGGKAASGLGDSGDLIPKMHTKRDQLEGSLEGQQWRNLHNRQHEKCFPEK
jgi:hypothetical protein